MDVDKSQSVWFFLDLPGQSVDKVQGIFGDVADFRKKVYEISKPALSDRTIASQLRVFLSVDEYKAKKAALDDKTKEPDGLKSGLKFPLPDGAGTEDDKALYVVAPPNASAALAPEFFQWSLLPQAGAMVVDRHSPFVNRDAEIVEAAKIFLQNAQLPMGVNDYKRTLVSSVQMFGSGKTQFGVRFQETLRKLVANPPSNHLADLLKIARDYPAPPVPSDIPLGDPNLYHQLIQAPFLYVDCRERIPYNTPDSRVNILMMEAIYSAAHFPVPSELATVSPATIDAFHNEAAQTRVPSANPGAMLGYLLRKHFGRVFLHVDEVSQISEDMSESAFRRFYELWQSLLHPMICQGHFVYCSGRTPLLYYAGRSRQALARSHWKVPVSPGDARCILLPWLRPQYVAELLAQGGMDPKHADKVFKWSGGVPRLVTFCLQFVRDHPDDAKNDNEATLTKLLTFLQSKRLDAEIDPSLVLPPALMKKYVEMIRLAALGIPLVPDRSISASNTQTELEIMSLLHLYAGEVQQEGTKCFISMPQVTLRQFLDKPDAPYKATIPILSSLLSVRDCRLLLNSHSGDALQAITEQVILARFQLASLGPKLKTSSELVHHFPWFTRTLSSTLRFTSCLISKAFPKVVNASGHNSTEQISRALLDSCLFEPNYAYIPAEKSSSEDLALCGFVGPSSHPPHQKGLLKIQCKHHSTDSTMSEADFHSEIFKAYVPNITSTLVFVCTNTKLARALEACAEKRDLLDQPILPPARPIFTSSTPGQPAEMITEQKEIAPAVWYFSPYVCDKMRASFVLAAYLKHLQTQEQSAESQQQQQQQRAAKRRTPSSSLASTMDSDLDQSQKHAAESDAEVVSSPPNKIQLFLESIWNSKLFPIAAEFHKQFMVLLGSIPPSFELAHLRNTPGCQDALFLSSEALQSLLTPTNYEWLVVKRQTVSLCQSYNSAFSAPLVSEQDTEEISQDLLLLAPPK